MHVFRRRFLAVSVDWRRLVAVILAICAIVAGIVAWIGYNYAARAEPVVIAATTIPPGTRISAEMLQVMHVPRARPESLRGMRDPRMVIGAYAATQIAADQIVQPHQIRATPVEEHVYGMPETVPEVLQGVVFELSIRGVNTVTTTDRLNIIALIDPERGADPAFSIGQMDAPGSGPRAVRVLRALNVLGVTNDAVLIEVTPMQSHYLWALAAAEVPFVGEITVTNDDALGPLRPQDMSRTMIAASERAAPANQTADRP